MAEEDSSANSKLYLESFVAPQARKDAGWDWHVAWEKWWDSKYIQDRANRKERWWVKRRMKWTPGLTS